MSKTINAYAKINLVLFITGKLPNGYHTLETIFAPINWYDTLTFELAETIEMTSTNADLPTDDSNLCVKAAKCLQAESGSQKGVKISLEKNVPFGAGLGGGSSDAAATLNALNELWELSLSGETLHKLATELGADVPYFLEMPALALGTGIGEELTDLQVAFPFSIVTVFPKTAISTAWAYKNFKQNFDRPLPDTATEIQIACETGDLSRMQQFENDFESVVYENHAEVKKLRDDLVEAGSGFTRLSGSGSAVFGVFEDDEKAKACYEAMSKRYPASLTPKSFQMK